MTAIAARFDEVSAHSNLLLVPVDARRRGIRYNDPMDGLLQLLAKIFVVLFFVGVVGSMVVVLISFVEDLELLVDTNEPSSVDATVTRA